MAYQRAEPWVYHGTLGDYKSVQFVLPTSGGQLAGLGQLSNMTGMQWLGLAAVAGLVYWFGFRKK